MSPYPRNPETGQVHFLPPAGRTTWPPAGEWAELEWSAWLSQQGWTREQITQYVHVDRPRYGLGFRRTPTEPLKWFYQPTPKQVEFHRSKIPNLLFGGARGGAKSKALRLDAYRHAWAIPNFRGLLMRRTYKQLKRNHLDRARMECEAINSYFGDVVMDLVPSEYELRCKPTGAVLIFGHCQNPGDELDYLSDEYDGEYLDELATFELSQVIGIAGSLRAASHTGAFRIVPRLVTASNPGGAQALWCVDWFMTKQVDREQYPKYCPDDYIFIPSKLWDNPYVMDPDGTFSTYEKRLEAYPPLRRRQLLEGDWYAIVGQFFPEFSSHHFRSVRIPEGTRIERWIDWGFVAPGYCVWAAMLPDGHIHLFQEWKFQQTIPSAAAQRIRADTLPLLKGPHLLSIGKSVGDPSMWATQTGESIAETFGRHGVHLTKGDHERVTGWIRLRQWLADAPDGIPWLTVDPIACPYFCRTIPALISDEHDPEDVDTTGDDHPPDAVRYGLMARPSPTQIRHETVYPVGSMGWMLQREQPPTVRTTGKVA